MELTLENLLENNRKNLDSLYRKEVLKLLEKIDHVVTLASIDKLGLQPVHISWKKFLQKPFIARKTMYLWVILHCSTVYSNALII